MSNYDYRDRPAYRSAPIGPERSKNRHILKWWTPEHDEIIKRLIAEKQWLWYWSVYQEIVKHTEPTILEIWKKADPACERNIWYNVLMYFAMSRAETLGFVNRIRKPQTKVCPLCNQKYVEDSLPAALVERLGGIDNIDFCSPCLRDIVLGSREDGNAHSSPEAVLKYLQELSALLGRVPPQGYGVDKQALLGLDRAGKLVLLKLLRERPSVARVKELFGSWLNALIQAGVLEDGTRKTSRGIHCIAEDGHVCLSLGEKTICDFLFMRKVAHEKEPKYPEANYRADFKVGDTLVEYFGLAGNPEYDAKTKEKMRICKKHKIRLVHS